MPSCRICGNELVPLLACANMPRGAQRLPTREEVARDVGVQLEVCQCTACGVVQLQNEPVPYWKDVIRAVGISGAMRAFRKGFFADFVNRHDLVGKKGLELGCGDGAYLGLLAETGMRAYGLEHDPGNVERCKKIGLEARQGYVEDDSPLPGAPFDAFFVFSWLEHLPSIPAFLRATLRNLADDAVGIVEVPNFDMILRGNLVTEFVIDHLYYFTEATFRHTLAAHGLDVLDCRPVWHDYILSAEVRKRRPLDTAGLVNAQERCREAFRRVYALFPRVALWGAGHQALTMLAMAGGAERLAYVVDSAPFKQGRYTPVTHRPIVAPDRLREDPVDALIVAAGSYSEEVCMLARERYGIENLFAVIGNELAQVQVA